MIRERFVKSNMKTGRTAGIGIALSLAVCLFILLAAIRAGSVYISLADLMKIIASHITGSPLPAEVDPMNDSIFWTIRMPRAITAFLVGGVLSVSGAVMQAVLQNPLASSYTLGVSSGASLGADIPFCIAGLAKWNTCLGEQYNEDPMAASCMRGEGTGTDLTPVNSLLDTGILLAKPDIGLSTGQIYTALDEMDVPRHPDIPGLIEILEDPEMSSGSRISLLEKNMVNVLENVVFASYPIVVYTRNNLEQESGNRNIFMSGSGPTLFAFADADDRAALEESLAAKGIQNIFWAKTTVAVETPQEES